MQLDSTRRPSGATATLRGTALHVQVHTSLHLLVVIETATRAAFVSLWQVQLYAHGLSSAVSALFIASTAKTGMVHACANGNPVINEGCRVLQGKTVKGDEVQLPFSVKSYWKGRASPRASDILKQLTIACSLMWGFGLVMLRCP